MDQIEMIALLDESVERFFDLKENPEEYHSCLNEQIKLTEKLYDFICGTDGKPDAILLDEIITKSDVMGWLLDLPFELTFHDMLDEAVKISRRYSELIESENFLGDLTVILAEEGRKEEALRQVEINLDRFPEDVWIVIKAGDALSALNENDEAEKLYFRAIEMCGSRSYDKDAVITRLILLLRKTGKNEKANELIERENIKPIRPAKSKKVGRNKPCPCGSGKKYKKCCGKIVL